MNFICPNLNHIPETYWNHRLKKQNLNFEVKYGYPFNYNDIVIVSDNEAFKFDYNYKNVYSWIIESPVILEYFTPNYFENLIKIENKFKKIFTHNKNLLNISNKFVFYPHGDCYINDFEDLTKTKFLSMIVSDKKWVFGHMFRHQIVEKLKHKFDLYGRGYNPIEKKETALNSYRFSIVVENCKEDYYFTEKIIDCFRTKTVPIYWGCPSIGNFFDIRSILTFDSIDELNNIISNISIDSYTSMIESIEKNYGLSFKYDTFFNSFIDYKFI